jgi:DNA polymerase-1
MNHPPSHSSALAHFKVRLSYATDAATATALVAAIVNDAGDGLIAVDFETTALPSERERLKDLKRRAAEAKGRVRACAERRAAARRGADGAAETTAALAIAKAELAALQSAEDHAERAGLDPQRSIARLCTLYGGGARVAVIDMQKVDWDVLAPVWERPLVMHNASFDLGYLAQRGIEPVGVDCTLQAVRLLNGPNATSLQTAAASYFGLELNKTLQVSDWGAKHLSLAQVTYAADDAVVTWWLAETVLPLLSERRTAYDIQVGAIPAVVRMQLRGILLDTTAHAALIVALKAERARLTGVYTAACDEANRPDLRLAGVPDNAPAIEALLTGLLEEQEQQDWPRTPKSGKLSTKRVDLASAAAAYPLLQALVDVGRIEKQLSTYGEGLAAQISPVTGRIHASYRVGGAISGRSTCSKPNMQNIPDEQPVEGLPSFRTLFVARAGSVFVAADWSSMEMRAAAHISGETAMTAAFERAEDLHTLTAKTMLRLNDPDSWLSMPEAERKRRRKHAKPVNFGRLYGQGALGLVASAREQYGLILDLATAKAWIGAFEAAYPDFTRWCKDFARACKRSGRIPIGREGGRIHEIHWNAKGYRYTQCLNLPIQGACADAFMLALAMIDAALFEAGIDGGPVAAPHDEIVLEVPEADAKRAADLLREAMTAAFAATFPGAPLRDLVTVKIGRSWAETK